METLTSPADRQYPEKGVARGITSKEYLYSPGRERRDWTRQMLANLAGWISIEDLETNLHAAFERI